MSFKNALKEAFSVTPTLLSKVKDDRAINLLILYLANEKQGEVSFLKLY
jgi:hypothetical protein